jgi:hypothetical protein
MPLLDLFWAMFLFFLWVAWFWLLIAVLGDIVRSDDLSNWGKAGWVLVTVALPYVGVLLYLVARGHTMQQRHVSQLRETDRAAASYIQGVASTPSTSEELARLAQLRDAGALTDEEFTAQKARVLAV